MSLKSLSDYTFVSRYSHYLPEHKRRETWSEAVERVYKMHKDVYNEKIEKSPELLEEINFAERQQKKKRVLAAQRSLQFGGPFILKHNVRLYNCSATHIDRPRAFQEAMYVLLCGCGVGFSVQYPHIKKLPTLSKRSGKEKTFVVPDSIEGWSDSIGVLLSSYFDAETEFSEYKGKKVVFDFSQIRPKGSMVAGQFLAPGPEGLFNSLQKIEKVIEERISSSEFKTDKWANKLRPIDCYDIVMHMSDAVLSGGVRRSATLCLFSYEDEQMTNAKTGDWFIKHPQRARSNNSAALIKGQVSKEQFSALMKSTRQFGEPGFVWLDDVDICYNPCVTGDTLINTSEGLKRADSLLNIPFKAVVNGNEYKSSGFVQTGVKPVYEVKTSRGHSIKVTGNHKMLTNNEGAEEWIEASNLTTKSRLVMGEQPQNVSMEEYSTEVASVKLCGYEPVYDCCVEEVHRFEANGLIVHNCVEIGLYPKTEDGRSGWEFCNLTEINGRYCDTEEKFLQCCRAAAVIGTLQAGYTKFNYLTDETREIVEREALLGVSITGIMDNPEILLNPKIQQKGAKEVKATNAKIAKLIGINASARTTCTKPAGCLDPTTIIKTSVGNKTLAEIFELNGYDLNDFADQQIFLVPNEKILVKDEKDDWKEITSLYVNGVDDTHDITFEDGQTISCTSDHKFLTSNRGWVKAGELKEGDDIVAFKSSEPSQLQCTKPKN